MAGRVYVTGDTHLELDIKKLDIEYFPEQRGLDKKDYVIICGDVALTWNATNECKYWRNWLDSKSFTTLFVDGNHENFDLLEEYPTEEWNGGIVRRIAPSIIHLTRGQVFRICGKSFFAFGGAESVDRGHRRVGKNWWSREMPSKEEYEIGLANLELYDNKVDFIITHDCSAQLIAKMGYGTMRNFNELNYYFDSIEKRVKFDHWYFGHHHLNRDIDEKHTVMYDGIGRIL